MAKNLKVTLFSGWKSIEGPRDGYPYRFFRELGDEYGVLDVGFAEYKSGKIPSPSYDDLVKLAAGHFSSQPSKRLTQTKFDKCTFGRYGTATFTSPEFQYVRSWYLSNDRDFIYAEYHNYLIPNNDELQELDQIVMGLTLSEETA